MKIADKRFLATIGMGIAAGAICALLDLTPGEDIWTFSSFSGSLGFWAITGMIVVMLYDVAWKSAVGTFLYFAFMNTTFFLVHFLISPLFQHPRIGLLTDALTESAVWLIPSAICGVCALIAGLAKKNNMAGVMALSLPIGLLIYEFIAVLLSLIINHKFLFQLIVDAFGVFLLWKLYSREKNKLWLAISSCVVAAGLIVFSLVMDGTILRY